MIIWTLVWNKDLKNVGGLIVQLIVEVFEGEWYNIKMV